MPSRDLNAEEISWVEEQIELLADGDSKYERELRNELTAATMRSNHAVEVFFAILQLAEQGRLVDTGARNEGRIVWSIAPTIH